MKISTKKTVQAGILGSISIALSLTPLGFIPIGVAKATTMHIPVIIGASSSRSISVSPLGIRFPSTKSE